MKGFEGGVTAGEWSRTVEEMEEGVGEGFDKEEELGLVLEEFR